MLARKVVTRSGRRIRGYFPSFKMGRMIEWESLLERDAILLMEFSPGIVAFREQPERILYSDGLNQREYFPDFEITLQSDVRIHIEVKPEEKLLNNKVATKLRNVSAHYHRNDRQFRILTDRTIRRQPLLSNLQRLFYLKRQTPELASLRTQFEQILAGPNCPGFDHVARLFGPDALLRLIALGYVACDLESPLSDNNPIRFPTEADHAAIYF